MADNGLRRWFANNGWLVVVLALALAATGYWGYQRQQALNNLQAELDSRYAQSFQELVEELDELEEELGALVVGEQPANVSVNLSRVWQSAYSAHEDITQMPIQSDELDNVKRLLMRTIDYSRELDQKIVGDKLDEAEKETLNKIREQIKNTDTQLEEINDELAQADFNWYDKRRVKFDEKRGEYAGTVIEGFEDLNNNIDLDGIDAGIEDTLGVGAVVSEPDVLTSLAGMEQEEVNEEEAIQVARDFLREPERYEFEIIHNEQVELEDGQTVETNLPTHSVRGEEAGDEVKRAYIDISKKGGEVVLMLKRRPFGEENLNEAEAVEQVGEFLEEKGYGNLVHNVSENLNRLVAASFVPREDEVLINSQEVVVEVALDNGEIVGFNSIDYLMNREERTAEELEPELTEEEAKEKLNDKIELTKEPELVIDKIRGEEKLCYQFIGNLEGEGDRYQILINAKTGEEELLENIESDLYQD